MFWLFCAFVAAHGLSLVEASRGHSLDAVCRLVNAVALVVVITQALGTLVGCRLWGHTESDMT